VIAGQISTEKEIWLPNEYPPQKKELQNSFSCIIQKKFAAYSPVIGKLIVTLIACMYLIACLCMGQFCQRNCKIFV